MSLSRNEDSNLMFLVPTERAAEKPNTFILLPQRMSCILKIRRPQTTACLE